MGVGANCAARLLAVLSILILGMAGAADALPKNAVAACKGVSFGDDDDDNGDAKNGDGIHFDLAGACAKLTGAINAYHQNNLSKSAAGVPALIRANGTPSTSRILNTLEATATFDARRKTPLGVLKTSLGTKWAKTSDDENDAGTFTVQSLYGSLAGWTAGYTDSLMNFWSGDFQFTATSPSRTVGIVSYEREITDEHKLAVAMESGLPTSRQNTEGIKSVDFSSPILTARWRYENDDGLSFHLSGLLRRAEFSADPRFPFLPRTATTRTGWGVSFGATVPVPAFGEDDSASMQATYTVDASPFLGTAVDLSTLASTIPTTGPTRGWSVVASFNHAWSEQWESNAFVSYLTLEAQLLVARPTVETRRFGVNLYWRPVESFRVGAEIGLVQTDVAANGPRGFLTGISGQATVGYLSAEWTF